MEVGVAPGPLKSFKSVFERSAGPIARVVYTRWWNYTSSAAVIMVKRYSITVYIYVSREECSSPTGFKKQETSANELGVAEVPGWVPCPKCNIFVLLV